MGPGSLYYRLAYRYGHPRWDTDRPRPELQVLARNLEPGRALDIGCGTGTSAGYLAQQGWEVVGIDLAPEAIAAASARHDTTGVRFVHGDATRLRRAGIDGPFDLVIDIGCFHTVPTDRRPAYATEVAAVTRPGTHLYLAGVSDPPPSWRLIGARGVTTADLRRYFGDAFMLVGHEPFGPIGDLTNFTLYHLVRTAPAPS